MSLIIPRNDLKIFADLLDDDKYYIIFKQLIVNSGTNISTDKKYVQSILRKSDKLTLNNINKNKTNMSIEEIIEQNGGGLKLNKIYTLFILSVITFLSAMSSITPYLNDCWSKSSYEERLAVDEVLLRDEYNDLLISYIKKPQMLISDAGVTTNNIVASGVAEGFKFVSNFINSVFQKQQNDGTVVVYNKQDRQSFESQLSKIMVGLQAEYNLTDEQTHDVETYINNKTKQINNELQEFIRKRLSTKPSDTCRDIYRNLKQETWEKSGKNMIIDTLQYSSTLATGFSDMFTVIYDIVGDIRKADEITMTIIISSAYKLLFSLSPVKWTLVMLTFGMWINLVILKSIKFKWGFIGFDKTGLLSMGFARLEGGQKHKLCKKCKKPKKTKTKKKKSNK